MKTLIATLSLIAILTGCNKFPCKDIYTENSSEIEIIKMNNELSHCLTKPPVYTNEFVIRSKKELNELLEQKNPADFCTNYNIPEINFLKYTLLGKLISGAVYCDLDNVMLTLDRNCDEKIFECTIEINCPMPDPGANVEALLLTRLVWIKVPKIPKRYSVVFNVKEIN